MTDLVAASVEVKEDVAEEGTGTENDGNSKRKRKVNRKYIDDYYDDGDEPKKAKQDQDEKGGVDVALLKKNRSERLNSNKQDKEREERWRKC